MSSDSDNRTLRTLVLSFMVGYLSVRYQLLKPLRRALPFLLLMGVWYMKESPKVDKY